MIQAAGQFVPVKLNAEQKEGAAVARKFGVTGYPAILFLTPSGQEQDRIGGYMPAPNFTERLHEIAATHRELPRLEARLKKNPADVTAAARLTVHHASRGNRARAPALLARVEKHDPKNNSGLLAVAYNAVGDMYQAAGEYQRAIPLFRKAAAAGRDPADVTYAHLSTALCYLSQRRVKEAVPYLESVVRLPKAPAEHRQQAQELLSQLSGRR